MRLENWIEQLVEEPFVRLFAGRLLPQDVAQHLVRALEDGERLGADGTAEVPGRYRIILNPEDLNALTMHHPNLGAQLAEALKTLTSRMNVRLKEPPAIILHPDPRLPLRAVRITPAHHHSLPQEHTQDITHSASPRDVQMRLTHQNQSRALHAYLVIQGERIFDLTQDTIRIGRALNNDLILEERSVSRYHAQLRRRYGRYILQDLGSSRGTSVNGFPVQEMVLRPGDVISLAGVDLIYAEETEDRPTKHRDTQPMKGSTLP